jgi:hypothetical protein
VEKTISREGVVKEHGRAGISTREQRESITEQRGSRKGAYKSTERAKKSTREYRGSTGE